MPIFSAPDTTEPAIANTSNSTVHAGQKTLQGDLMYLLSKKQEQDRVLALLEKRIYLLEEKYLEEHREKGCIVLGYESLLDEQMERELRAQVGSLAGSGSMTMSRDSVVSVAGERQQPPLNGQDEKDEEEEDEKRRGKRRRKESGEDESGDRRNEQRLFSNSSMTFQSALKAVEQIPMCLTSALASSVPSSRTASPMMALMADQKGQMRKKTDKKKKRRRRR